MRFVVKELVHRMRVEGRPSDREPSGEQSRASRRSMDLTGNATVNTPRIFSFPFTLTCFAAAKGKNRKIG